MDKIMLTATPALRVDDVTIGTAHLRLVTDLHLTSIAVPQQGDAALAKALKSQLDLNWPEATASTSSGGHRLVRMAVDQFFLISADLTAAEVAAHLDRCGYTTDQTDNWVMCHLSGAGALDALERIVPIDLHPETFPVGAFARTQMEHMGAAVLRTDDGYLLMSARSSAASFWHALETSVRYTQTPLDA